MKVINTKINGLILAGGYSKRMGRDKALIEFHGKPQVEHIFELLKKYCSEVYLSKRPDQVSYKNFPSINDTEEFSNQGPLGGILSAMKTQPQHNWLVVACDLPYITGETFDYLFKMRNPQKIATAFISTADGLPEPLCTIWEGHAYEAILKLFNEGVHCPRKILIKSDTNLISQKNPRWLENINSPEEYQAYLKSN